MARKKGYVSPKSQQIKMLKDSGIEVPPKVCGKKDSVNPIEFYSPNKHKYEVVWTNYDMNQCISRYVWENLPNGLTSWNLERMIYFRGTLVGFKYGGKGYILPYVISGKINPYGFPTHIRPITYNGQAVDDSPNYFFKKKGFALPVDGSGNATDNYSAVLLYDAIPTSASGTSPSRFALNQIIIRDIADTLARVNINIVVSNKKILLQIKDAKQREVVQEELKIAFGSDCPFAILTSELDINAIQNSNDFEADDLFNTIKNYDAIRCFMNGIASKGFGSEKKERISTGELAGGEEEKELILDLGLDLRKLFCEQCNKKFGWNISVRKRSDDYDNPMGEYSTEVNANGMNAMQETRRAEYGK